MIVGDGLIANKLKFIDSEDIIIFASGVSNSNENNESEFERERELLSTFIGHDKKLIYFSSCLIFYSCHENKKYVKHKLEIEELIEQNFKNFLIFRLPNVIGFSKNKFTFFNFISEKLKNNSDILIEELSSRYFIDIDDIAKYITPFIIDTKNLNQKINVGLSDKILVKDLILIMKEKLNSNSEIKLVNEGCDVTINFSFFMKKNNIKKFKPLSELIEKYL